MRVTAPATLEAVEKRLLAAGRTLIALRVSKLRPAGFRNFWPEIMPGDWNPDTAIDDVYIAPPTSDAISAMDEALGWLRLIPDERYAWRRVAGLKSLNHPVTRRPLLSDRRIALLVKCSHVTVNTWYFQGLNAICAGVAENRTFQTFQNNR